MASGPGTTVARWPVASHRTSSDIADSGRISEAGLIAAANRSFQPQQIVVGHANLPTITHCFGQLLDIIRSRNLQTVTLNDVYT
jgi:peptidoglycan-N-acetylglucosamine deacetylase